jgi:hypothetical protein
MLDLRASAQQAAWRAARGWRRLPTDSGPAGVVMMGGLWLDVLGFVAVFAVVFVLVVACERDRH